MRREALRNGNSELGKNLSKMMDRIVNKVRRKNQMENSKEICANPVKYAAKWWKLTGRFIKPFNKENLLMPDANGNRSYYTTLSNIKDYYQDLQYKQFLTEELDHLDGWLYIFFIKMYAPESLLLL